MNIIANIEKAYDERGRVEVDVPEWGCALWFDTMITVAQQQQIRKGIDPSDEAALLTSFIIHRAETEDGKPAFERNATTRAVLEGKADLRVLQRIVAEVGDPPSVDEAKND